MALINSCGSFYPMTSRNPTTANFVTWIIVMGASHLLTTGSKAEESTPNNAVPDIVRKVRDSVVVITFTGRDGKQQGIGTGFVVDPDGLIATNLHVIGEARPIQVRMPDGTEHVVTSIHATDKSVDMALVRIDRGDLLALELAPNDQLKQGDKIVAFGNPMGLEQSVVQGIVSAVREINGQSMLQLAIPVEPGNSGSPVVDMDGRVHGLMTMKSRVTENLCFAVAAKHLKPLIDNPNPIPMNRWLTIGALDEKQWTTRFGSDWRRRAGEILVREPGRGFGGRSLCISKNQGNAEVYEIGVHVRLDDESGAAGLAFCGDGGDRHYAFYPSSGRLRLTRFDGPTVFTWNVLQELESVHYHPTEWNHLKVHIHPDRLQCYVNDHLVIDFQDANFRGTEIGLAKFRDTEAHFRGFQVGATVKSGLPSEHDIERALTLIDQLPSQEAEQALMQEGVSTQVAVERRAALLEQQAAGLRRFGTDLHVRDVARQLEEEFVKEESEIELARCVLLIAQLDDQQLDVSNYLLEIDNFAAEIRKNLAEFANVEQRITALNQYLFEEYGFHGCRNNYYSYANSYLNQVIEDREGLPILLSVLYMEVGRRINVDIHGIGLPGRFVVGVKMSDDDYRMIDVFDQGAAITTDGAARLVADAAGRELVAADLKPTSKQEIVLRVLRNLSGVAQRNRDDESWLRYLTATLAINDQLHESRAMRAIVRHKTARLAAAVEDLEWFIEHQPKGIDLTHIRAMRERWLAE